MYKVNRDILYLIFEELQDNKETLISCLSINRTWCEVLIPILWKNPWKYLKKGKEESLSLLNVIISHSPDKLKKNDLIQRFKFLKNSYQSPSYDYISYCKHLNLEKIERIISIIDEKSETLMIKNEVINLFINGNTKFTHLYIPHKFNYQIHHIPGAKRCFSELKNLYCNTGINDNVLSGLMEICKSIKELDLFIEVENNNYGIVKLIETPKNLTNIRLLTKHYSRIDEPFCEILENSLIKHSNTIKYFTITKQPTTDILSFFVNLKILELDDSSRNMTWDCLENLSLPYLEILKARRVPIKVLTSLIENAKECLTEIKIDSVCHNEVNNKRIIQAIYKNCPNLKYLKLLVRNCNILELENLLIRCQYLKGIYILFEIFDDELYWEVVDWGLLFEILTRSSPVSLFKFKFHFDEAPNSEPLKLFFENWKGRNPMLLQFPFSQLKNTNRFHNVIDKYQKKGIVKKYDIVTKEQMFEDFEWIQKRFD